MTAELLREAAALMRTRAEAATPGPWENCGHGWIEKNVAATASMRDADAEHIASWHPVVALAVAKWLDHEARYWEESAKQGVRMPLPRKLNALEVARAYLGIDEPIPYTLTDKAPA